MPGNEIQTPVIPAQAGTQTRLPSRTVAAASLTEQSKRMGSGMLKNPCVYILASGRNGTLYIGVTSDIAGRVSVHIQDLAPSFTSKYRVHHLVYYEMHETMEGAIRREKRLKKWNRLWKLRLIEQANPEWIDLFDRANCAILDLPSDIARRRD